MKTIIFVSRCAWTLYNFRKDIMCKFLKEGYKVYALGGPEGDYGDRLKKLGIYYIELPIKRSLDPLGDLRLFFKLSLLYKKLDPHIVFHYTIKPIVYGTPALAFVGYRNAYNFITGLGHLFIGQRGISHIIGGFLYRFSLHFSKRVLFYNETDYSYFLSHGIALPYNSSFVPGSGVDTVRFGPLTEKMSKGLRIGMVSRFLVEKGVWEFVKMAEKVREIVDGVEFVMVGGPDKRNPSTVDERDINMWRDLEIDVKDRIDDVPSFLKGIDILVHPTYREGLPRVLLEGGSVGIPLVTTDTPGSRDVVDDPYVGFLVPVRDAEVLTHKIIKLIFSPALRRKQGKRARKRMVARFSNQKVFQRIFSLIEKG